MTINAQKINGKMLYKELKSREQDIKDLTKMGVISPNWMRDLRIFERYNEYRSKNNSKMDSWELTAEDFGVSWQSVRLIATKMKKD
jgi:hypothetical protein